MRGTRRCRSFRIGRFGREEGAAAILIALLTLFVLLPLTALGTSAFIRAGAGAELTLAADAGSLAGAASIPVGNLKFLVAYLEATSGVEVPEDPDIPGGSDVPCELEPCDQVPNEGTDPNDLISPNEEINEQIALISPGSNPIEIACEQARAALASNGRIGDLFESDDSEGPVSCRAEYLSDPDFLTAFGDCVNVVQDNPLGDTLIGLADTLPGLLKPGIKVTLTRGVDPPLESIVGIASSEYEAISAARRQFKNAVVLPTIPGTSIDIEVGVTGTVDDIGVTGTVEVGVTTTSIDLNPIVDRDEALEQLEAVDQAIDDYNATTVPDPPEPLPDPLPDSLPQFPSECRGVLPALRDDFVDVANPPEQGAPSAEEVLPEAVDTDAVVLVLRLFSGTPFFDFLPVCVEKADNDFVGVTGASCVANAPGAFRAALVPPL